MPSIPSYNLPRTEEIDLNIIRQKLNKIRIRNLTELSYAKGIPDPDGDKLAGIMIKKIDIIVSLFRQISSGIIVKGTSTSDSSPSFFNAPVYVTIVGHKDRLIDETRELMDIMRSLAKVIRSVSPLKINDINDGIQEYEEIIKLVSAKISHVKGNVSGEVGKISLQTGIKKIKQVMSEVIKFFKDTTRQIQPVN